MREERPLFASRRPNLGPHKFELKFGEFLKILTLSKFYKNIFEIIIKYSNYIAKVVTFIELQIFKKNTPFRLWFSSKEGFALSNTFK